MTLKSKNEVSGKSRFLMLTGDILAQITCAESAECVYSVNIEMCLLLTMWCSFEHNLVGCVVNRCKIVLNVCLVGC